MCSLYEQLPSEVLVQFYYYINRNIEQEILSKAMNVEIELIEKSAQKRGLPLEDLKKLAAELSIQREWEISAVK
ncbi:hypothetical protein ACQYAD_09035 [Neobacillus sp. SM06]|uniref:hypothetical protein n=1 Tax=Neobacillus sp. SM06 TaxID=3422492 RepID=UPI003D272779